MLHFAVVEFANPTSVDIVPVKWLSDEEDHAYWPSDISRVSQVVKELQDVDKSWDVFPVRVLSKAGE